MLKTLNVIAWYLPGLYLDAVQVGVEAVGALCKWILKVAWIWNERVDIEDPLLWKNLSEASVYM